MLTHRGADRRTDRLPRRDAGNRPRPRSRPRHRHRQTSRTVRHHPRRIRHRTRRQPQTPRLPDHQPRRRLRPRPHRHNQYHERASAEPTTTQPATDVPDGRRRPGRVGGRVGRGGRRTHRGADRRTDRLPRRDARSRPRPRSRPRHRHRQTSRTVRHHPRRIRHRTRRQPQTPRLPHHQPRRRLRPATAPHNKSPATRPPPTAADGPAPATAAGIGDPGVEVDSFPRRVPVVVLRPALEHCMPHGCHARCRQPGVRAWPTSVASAGAVVDGLHQLGVETFVVDDAPDADDARRVCSRHGSEAGPVTGVYWLPALDDEGPHATLDRDHAGAKASGYA